MLIHDIQTHRSITRTAFLLKQSRWKRSEKRRRIAKRVAARSVMLGLQRAQEWRWANGTEVPF